MANGDDMMLSLMPNIIISHQVVPNVSCIIPQGGILKEGGAKVDACQGEKLCVQLVLTGWEKKLNCFKKKLVKKLKE